MSVEQFEVLMREQLKLYTQSRLSSMSEFWTISEQDFTTIGTLKHILMEQIKIKEELSQLASSHDYASRASQNSGRSGGPSKLRMPAAADDVDALLASFCLYFKEAVATRELQGDLAGAERKSTVDPVSKARGRSNLPRTPGSTVSHKVSSARSSKSPRRSVALDEEDRHVEWGDSRESETLQGGKPEPFLTPGQKLKGQGRPKGAQSLKSGSIVLATETSQQLFLDDTQAETADQTDLRENLLGSEQTNFPEESADCNTTDAHPAVQNMNSAQTPVLESEYVAAKEEQDSKLAAPHDAAAGLGLPESTRLSFTESRALQKGKKTGVNGRGAKSLTSTTLIVQLAYAEKAAGVPKTPATKATSVVSPNEPKSTRRKGAKLRGTTNALSDGNEIEEVGGDSKAWAETGVISGN